MSTHSRHPARIVTVLAVLAVVLPGLVTAAYADPPGVPTEVSGSGGYRSVSFAFVPPTDDGGSPITRYEAKVGTGPWRTVRVAPLSWDPSRLGATVRGLEDDTRYTVAVRAVNADGTSRESSQSEFTTARTFGPPDRTSELLYPGDHRVVLVNRFDEPQFIRVPTGHRVVARPVNRRLATRSMTCSDPRCTLARLRNGSRYKVTIRAYRDYTVGKRTVRFWADPVVVGPVIPWDGPQSPTILSAEPGEGSAALRWSIPDLDFQLPVEDFEVSVDGVWQRIVTTEFNTRTVVTGLEDGRTYTLRVRGLTRDGKPGRPSKPVEVTPGAQG